MPCACGRVRVLCCVCVVYYFQRLLALPVHSHQRFCYSPRLCPQTFIIINNHVFVAGTSSVGRSVCVSCKKGTAAKGFCFIGKQQTGRADRRRHRDEGEIKSSPRTKGGLNTLLFFPHAMPRPLPMLSSQLLCLFSVIISFASPDPSSADSIVITQLYSLYPVPFFLSIRAQPLRR